MKKEVNVFEMRHRYFDIKMKGTWGYNPHGISKLTSISWIEEFFLENTSIEDSELFMHGEDRYGRELKIPFSRVLGVSFLDTPEQKKLLLLNRMIKSLEDVISSHDEDSCPWELFDMLGENKDERNMLIEKGIKTYERKQMAVAQ